MCLHAAMTCAHGMCSFWGFPQSHVLWSSLIVNFPIRRLSLVFTLSSTWNWNLWWSNCWTKWVFGLGFFFGNEFGYNKCVNLSGGDHCISLSPTVNKIFVYLLIHGSVIGKFWIFFSTEFSDSAKLVVMCPHRFPSSYAKVHCSLGIWSSRVVSCGLSSCNSR